jgi:hypothetical protein
MSRLKLFQPEGLEGGDCAAEAPITLPFAVHAGHFPNRIAERMQAPVRRARTLHTNRRCPSCSHPMIEPIELDDAIYNRSRLPIPGTATLVGFHCCRCHTEWPA